MGRPTLMLSPSSQVFCKFWGNECAAFQQRSGHTYLLNEIGTELFMLLAQRPSLSRHDFLAHLQAAFEFQEDVQLDACVDGLITEYQSLGLLDVTETGHREIIRTL